jgi:hypothetical protein
MNSFLLLGEELKKHRQTKQISLMQVSDTTRINGKFLEAIEAGQFSVLPGPYVRAFVREYAVAVELNAADILRKYDEALQKSKPEPPVTVRAREVQVSSPGPLNPQQQARLLRLTQRNIVPLLSVTALLILAFFLSNTGSIEQAPARPAEVSFDRAVRESEAASVKTQLVRAPSPIVGPVSADSLRLEMSTVDSLWIMVVIDGKRTVEYLFPPKFHRIWTAKEQFAITMGNASSATFRLNGKELGALGKRGAVVRNAILSSETAAKL